MQTASFSMQTWVANSIFYDDSRDAERASCIYNNIKRLVLRLDMSGL